MPAGLRSTEGLSLRPSTPWALIAAAALCVAPAAGQSQPIPQELP